MPGDPLFDSFREEMADAERYGYGTVNFSPEATRARFHAARSARRAEEARLAYEQGMAEEIGRQSRVRRASAEAATALLESFGIDRSLPYRMAGANPTEAGYAAGATRSDAAANPFTVGLGNTAGSTIGTMYLASRLGAPFLPKVATKIAPTLGRQSLSAGVGFGAASGAQTLGQRLTEAAGLAQPIDTFDVITETGKSTVIGGVTGAAFPSISRAGRAVGGRAVGIKPGVRPNVAQTIGRRAIEEGAFFGAADFLMTPGDLQQRGLAALQGILVSPLTGAADLHHDFTSRLGEMTPKENARAAVTLVDEYIKTMPLSEVERYFKSTAGWPGAIRDYALRHIEGNRKILEARQWKPEVVADGRDIHDGVAGTPAPRTLRSHPTVDAVLRDGRAPADFTAWLDRKVPSFILPDPTGTVLTPKERAAAEGLNAIQMDAMRKAGANAIKTSRGTLFYWPDLVEKQLTTPGGSRAVLEQALSERRGAPTTLDKAKFTPRGLAGALRALADRDAIGEVLGYGPGNAMKEGATILAVGYDAQGFEVRSIATTPERLETTKKALVAAGADPNGVGIYDISAADAIVGRRLRTTWSPEGPKFDGELPAPKRWTAPSPAKQKLLGVEAAREDEPERWFATPSGKLIAASRLEEMFAANGDHPVEIVRQDMGEFAMRDDALERLGREIEAGRGEGLYVAPIKVGKDVRWAIVETEQSTGGIRPTSMRPIELPPPPPDPPPPPPFSVIPPEDLRDNPLAPPRVNPLQPTTPNEAAEFARMDAEREARRLRAEQRRGAAPIGPETYGLEPRSGESGPEIQQPPRQVAREPLLREPIEPVRETRTAREDAVVVSSRDFEAPAETSKRNPLDVGDTEGEPAKIQLGAPLTIMTDRNEPVATHLALIESDDLHGSHDENNRPTEKYPQRLQPRNVAPGSQSSATVAKIAAAFETTPNELLGLDQTRASGPPIVWVDTKGEVGVAGKAYPLAGNHRKRAIDQLRKSGDRYDKMLAEKAPRVGLDPQTFKKPVLVRVVDDMPYARAVELAGPLQEGGRELTKFERSIGEAQAARFERASDVKVEWVPEGKLEPRDVEAFLKNNRDLAMRLYPRGLEGVSIDKAAERINDVLLGALPRELLDAVSKAGKTAEDAVYEIAPALHRFRTLAEAGKIKPEWDITPLIGPALKLLPEFAKHVGAGKGALSEWAQVIATKPLGFAADDDILRVLPDTPEKIGLLRDVIGIGTGFAIADRATGYFARKMLDYTNKALADADVGQARMFDTVIKKPDGKIDFVAELFSKGHATAVDKLVTAMQKARALARGQIGTDDGRPTEEAPRANEGRRSGSGGGHAVGSSGSTSEQGGSERPRQDRAGARDVEPRERRGDGGRGDSGEPARRAPQAPLTKGDRRIVETYARQGDVDSSSIASDLAKHLSPHQSKGVALALEKLAPERPHADRGFIIADGTGVGKTREILTLAETFRRRNKGVLIVAPAEVLKRDAKDNVRGSYADDGETMGVKFRFSKGETPKRGEILITTYNADWIEKVKGSDDVVVMFDEAHSLKNQGSSRTSAIGPLLMSAHAVVYASATWGDKPEHLPYLVRAGVLEGRTLNAQLEHLGYRKQTRSFKTKDGGSVERELWAPFMRYKERRKRLFELSRRLAETGFMVKREISMDGVTVDVRRVNYGAETREVEAKLREAFGDPDGRALLRYLRQLEPHKVAATVEETMKEIAEGRSVVIFANRVNYSEEKRKIKDRYGEIIGEEVITSSEGTLKTLKAALIKAGIKPNEIAEIHGGAEREPGEEMGRFQRNEARVVIATPESGGTGISLDDRSGTRPRTMLFMTAPLSGTANAQAWGRVWRLPTKGDARIRYIIGESAAEQRLAGIVLQKAAVLGGTLKGEHMRLVDLAADLADADLGEVMADIGDGGGKPKKRPRSLPRIDTRYSLVASLVREAWGNAKAGEPWSVTVTSDAARKDVQNALRAVGVEATIDGQTLSGRKELVSAKDRDYESLRDWLEAERHSKGELREHPYTMPVDKAKNLYEVDDAMELLALWTRQTGDKASLAEYDRLLKQLVAKRDELADKGRRPC